MKISNSVCLICIRRSNFHWYYVSLQTLNSISAEKNSTIIFPLPIDLLSHFMNGNGSSNGQSKAKQGKKSDWVIRIAIGLSRPALPTPITPPRITLPPPNTTPKTMMSSSQVATSIAIDRRHNPTRLYSKPKQQTVSLMNLSSTTRSWKKKDKKKILISVDLETVIQFAPYYYYYTMILISSRPA